MNKSTKFLESTYVSDNLDSLVTSYLFSLHETFQQTRQNKHLSKVNGVFVYEVSSKFKEGNGSGQLIIRHKIPEIKYERIHYFITKKPIEDTFYILEDERERKTMLSKVEYLTTSLLKTS
ncbi:hypothetical protein [Haloplasma contractile]|uniref:Uncharacterized protein n=1 Tax=Haloplasma contractile SSD-17B TaxID=1033810 RepID=U2DRF1_9MOLU|nr:hypothetical protein [Haloplasma contractile]ERJ11152.1 hypothetical protein HLPCO_002817 [Haloplasma contractile SSD-17B]